MEHIPARVMALAKVVEDTPIAWKEYDNGSIVIVFANKGKRIFDPVPQAGTAAPAENVAQVATPASSGKTKSKRKEK